MDTKIARINSRLYFDLFSNEEVDGDKLVSVFSILKTSRTEDKYYSYTSRNNKFIGGYSLLRAKTNLTLHTIKTYVPVLIDMGLISILENGDVYVMGGEKIKTLYSSKKLVPIIIGKNLHDTAVNSLSVRCHSAQLQQEKQILKKQNRSELLKQLSNPTTNKLYKKAKRLAKRLNGEEITIIDEVILSNQGYAVLKRGVENNKSMGCYWKQKLVKKGLIESKRRFKKLKAMSYGEYLNYISFYPDSKTVYRNGFLCVEEIAALKNIDLTIKKEINPILIKEELPKKEVKGLKHLEFDMIAWWKNN